MKQSRNNGCSNGGAWVGSVSYQDPIDELSAETPVKS